jgi:hypothetical protein
MSAEDHKLLSWPNLRRLTVYDFCNYDIDFEEPRTANIFGEWNVEASLDYDTVHVSSAPGSSLLGLSLDVSAVQQRYQLKRVSDYPVVCRMSCHPVNGCL